LDVFAYSLQWGFLENLLSIAKSSLLKPTDDDDSQQPFDSSGSAIKDHTLEAVAQDAINRYFLSIV
jgi:hypothetical protein